MASDTITRREALLAVTAVGLTSTVMQRSIAAQINSQNQITSEMVRQAEWIAGLQLGDEERESILKGIEENLTNAAANRKHKLANADSPAIYFFADPLGENLPTVKRNSATPLESAAPERPDDETLAFLPVTELAALIRTRQVSSMELTQLYLDRLHRYDGMLNFVVTYTDDLALAQAAEADREIASGQYRGPLHGIPWGAKDLISYPGYPTTWGATPFKDQVFETKATVAARLEEAGAVLVAKLSMGALAMGDKWFGKMTRNPWDPRQGASGSSAGSSAAVASGAIGFAIGTETLGSIISPSRRCGATGLRPTFGRVSRHGCMTLSWSMDKLGPIARSVEDTALILDAIHGTDGYDPTAVNRPFHWPSKKELSALRVGFVESEWKDDRAALDILNRLQVQLVPIEIPSSEEAWPACIVLDVECAEVFDDLVRNNVTEDLNSWPKIFRAAEFISGVDYLRAMRIRHQLMVRIKKAISNVDLYIGGNDLPLTNLTGHPSISLPYGKRERIGREVPGAITFTGRLFEETILLQLARAFQMETEFHLRRPNLEGFLAERNSEQQDDAQPQKDAQERGEHGSNTPDRQGSL